MAECYFYAQVEFQVILSIMQVYRNCAQFVKIISLGGVPLDLIINTFLQLEQLLHRFKRNVCRNFCYVIITK